MGCHLILIQALILPLVFIGGCITQNNNDHDEHDKYKIMKKALGRSQ
tara:strand:+ start:181 stop:321 length:141 start_codon:yes stop_codon:yes gene_type:complete